MDEAKPTEEPMPATSPLGRASSDPIENASDSDRDATTSEPSLIPPSSYEQLALIRQATGQQEERIDRKEMSDESKAVILELLKDQLRAMMMMGDSVTKEGTEGAVSVTKLQPGSDIEKKEQELEGKTDGSKSPQHPQDGGCPDCHTKMVWIGELEMRLTDQEEIARQQVEAAVMRQQDLSKLSSRINELEAQQSGQASTLEDPASRPLPTHYYCSDCSWTQKKLYDAKQKNRELEREVERRKQKAYALGYEVDKARDDREVLRQRLDEANIEIARLRAQLGPRTSKL